MTFVPPSAPIAPGIWRCRWEIRNLGAPDFSIGTAWLPHGRFRSERQTFEPPIAVPGGGATRLTFDVACSEERGASIENTFIIFTATQVEVDWRVFARMTVETGPGGVPTPRTELVTSSRVGFSEDDEPASSF